MERVQLKLALKTKTRLTAIMPANPIRLFVGLGNPGNEYQRTRHNAGVWFVDRLLQISGGQVKQEGKFLGQVGKITWNGQPLQVLIPSTYMNQSGDSVLAVAQFFKLSPSEILVAHDELDHNVGSAKLKWGGGHGGHNGLRDITNALGESEFARLRLGIGHPGNRSQVTPYVLGEPSTPEREAIDHAIELACGVIPDLVQGQWNKAVKNLHDQLSN
jgi:PTH1 family peptidyl-tRNA hydrolase